MITGLSAGLLAAQSDRRLVELARMGQQRAFEALVQRYRRPLLCYGARLGLADGLAEDVLQLAYLQAWQALERGVEVREPRAWLYRIVHNAALNAMRGSRELDPSVIDPDHVAAVGAGESGLERAMQVREALADVAALPHMQREAILLSAVDGRTHEEVASMLGVSEGAVRGLLYRARAALRAAAAALTPQPLISWACGCIEGTSATGERLAELSAPAGAAGVTGVLLKGVAAAVTAAVLVAGAAVAPLHGHGGHRSRASAAVSGPARAVASDNSGSSGRGRAALLTADARRSTTSTTPGAVRARTAPRAFAAPARGGRPTAALVPVARATPRPTGGAPAGGATPSPGVAGQAGSPVATPASVGGGGAPATGANGASAPHEASGGQAEQVPGGTGEGAKGPGSGSEAPATGGGSEQPPAGGESGSGPSGGAHEESSDDGSGDGGDSGESKTREGSGDDGEPGEGHSGGGEHSGSDDGSSDDGHAKGEASHEGSDS
ncbi:MAG TPA: sigma-70 family RNA polymerase sigma factor [Solirubrobacteraceae bacterium]|nr:sigma-70 family RNA polymerase sigma factor [Solirubrobacteraceae bacterium]